MYENAELKQQTMKETYMKMLLVILTLLGSIGSVAYAADASVESKLQPADSFTTTENTVVVEGVQPAFEGFHPPQRMVVCYSQDHHGYTYSATGYYAHDVQHEAHHHCEDHSGDACWDLGCRSYY